MTEEPDELPEVLGWVNVDQSSTFAADDISIAPALTAGGKPALAFIFHYGEATSAPIVLVGPAINFVSRAVDVAVQLAHANDGLEI